MKERIKKIRNDAGLNQTDFAKKLLVSRSAICKMESGENSPSEQTIGMIIREFNVNEKWLKEGIGAIYIPRTRNQEIFAFANKVMQTNDDTFKKRLIHALSQMDESGWIALEKLVNELTKKD